MSTGVVKLETNKKLGWEHGYPFGGLNKRRLRRGFWYRQ
jgi:hypothetical protein